ncbi:DUF1048 domain-containing protein [Homoserinibacter sp. YIM 151385]|uniref:DUF1048 domain-containing protein n=1 Tax=Homoserinibacter sp. YIM 151385 TaxID=2985506 RepID=UPI0022F09D7B|nr:DUF1048 domain-containing protein [Homoserinibacter sp. YIM 151385]WBU36961.1 DUF1048 domain-containing protein [Homoserinibacter sp. YIM 151385]
MTMWIEKIIGPLDQKKQYRQSQARIEALPAPYAAAAKAVQRYLTYSGGIVDGETLVQLNVDHADLWERAAADGTSVRDIVGEDPVGFAEDFARAYQGRQWIDKERTRLTDAIDRAARDQERES